VQSFTAWLEEGLGFSPEVQVRLLATLVILLGLWMFRRLVLRMVHRRTDEPRSLYLWKKNATYLNFFLGMLFLGIIWFERFQSVATFLGLVSAGIAIALKDLLANLAGWMFILIRRPFEVGDRIQIGEIQGDVIDMRIFQFTVLEIGNWVHADQSTGRVIHVPNSKVFFEPQANYTKGFQYIWNEIRVPLTFESDWRAAKEILTEIAERQAGRRTDEAAKRVKRASRQFMIFYSTLTPKVYTTVEDHGVMLTIRYLCSPRRRRGTEETIWEEILDSLGERPDIEFAYPTQRFFRRDREARVGREPKAGTAEGPGGTPEA